MNIELPLYAQEKRNTCALACSRQSFCGLRASGRRFPGTIITAVDPNGTNIETVVVSELVYTGGPPPTATAFKATFQKTHAANFVINFTKPGNPGPQPQFTLKDNGAVVPYWTPVN